jgi:two-component system, chemotaxis family, protein-glutamate methylesterase/glutaminase
MTKTRVLVVEDSLTVRKRLVEVVGNAHDMEVVGEAADGQTAITLCEALRPDVITMDMMLPHMTGLEATEHIMAHCPTPILIVSASTNRGELFRTYDALSAGALDVLDKPLGTEVDHAWEQRFISTLRLVSRIRVITHVRAKLRGPRAPSAPATSSLRPVNGSELSAVAIGASTGGPGALVDILGEIPRGFPLPILLVIHIGEPFGAAFAEWLDGHSQLRIAYAKDGEPLPPVGQGRVIMAPPNMHLVLAQGRLRLVHGPERHSCRPSVDVLFESVARELGAAAAACLLTGMGKDGAAGLLEVRRAGGTTIAQDEATSVVYGMPREAAILGAAERILPLPRIAAALAALGPRARRT